MAHPQEARLTSRFRSPLIWIGLLAATGGLGVALWSHFDAPPVSPEADAKTQPLVTRKAGAVQTDRRDEAAVADTAAGAEPRPDGKGPPPPAPPGPPPPEVQAAMQEQARQEAFDQIPAQAETAVAKLDAAAALDEAQRDELLLLLTDEYEQIFSLISAPDAADAPVKALVGELRADTDAVAAEILRGEQLEAWKAQRSELAGTRR